MDGVLSVRIVRKAAYRRLSAQGSLVYRRFADHDLVVDPGDLVGKTVLETGGFDRARTEAACRRAGALSRRRTVLEIGANIGTQTVYFLRSGVFTSIVSLEPDPRNLSILELNISINGLGDQVTVVAAAAGATAGLTTLVRDAGNSGGATLRAANRPAVIESEIAVPVVRLDDLVEGGQLVPDEIGLIWMDAEGFEEEILSAATHLLAIRTPLALEFTPAFYDEGQGGRILRILFQAYGEVSVMEGDGFRPITETEALALRRRVDLFCC